MNVSEQHFRAESVELRNKLLLLAAYVRIFLCCEAWIRVRVLYYLKRYIIQPDDKLPKQF